MTAIVGLLCKEGVVIGADSAVSFANPDMRTIEQPADKINIISNSIIVAGTGSVGLGQRFTHLVQNLWDKNILTGDYMEFVKKLSTEGIQDFSSTYLKTGQYGALLAFPKNKKHYLCEFSVNDFQPELKDEKMWYVSMGSSQFITDPFLGFIRDLFWQESRPNMAEGIFAVKWTLQQAIDLNPGGVKGPIKIAVLENNNSKLSARMLSEEELGQRKQNIYAMKEHIREFKNKLQTDDAIDVPKSKNNI